jgi:hypothetical protein
MRQDEDTVGVVVPMFNAERTIAATLRSICGKTRRKLDIVVAAARNVGAGIDRSQMLPDSRLAAAAPE